MDIASAKSFALSRLAQIRQTLRAYWFAPGCTYSIAFCRIGVFYAIWLSWDQCFGELMNGDIAAFYAVQNPERWFPKGLLKFWGSAPPSVEFMTLCLKAAYVAPLFAMAGFLTRISAVVAVLSSMLCISMVWSWNPYWSHGHNVVYLAGIAFMFGASGDTLSVDAVLRWIRRRWLQSGPVRAKVCDGRYRWPVMLGQMAVALMGLSAAYNKTYKFTSLAWAFSDSLRNSFAESWVTYRTGAPDYVVWLATHEWAWKGMALLELIAQLAPFAACFLIRRPLLRFLCGGVLLILQVIGLDVIMGMWHPMWLPLAVFFVDWDRLIAWIGKLLRVPRREDSRSAYPSEIRRRTATRLPSFFIGLYLGYSVLTVIAGLDTTQVNYPFTSWRMFGSARALKPFSRHRHWPFYLGKLQTFRLSNPEVPIEFPYLISTYPEYYRIDDFSELRSGVEAWKELLGSEKYRGSAFDVQDVGRIELYKTINHIPAYPGDPFAPVVVHSALKAVWEAPDSFRSARGVLQTDDDGRRCIRVETVGFKDPQVHLWYRTNVRENSVIEPLRELDGHLEDGCFYFETPDFGSYYTLIRITDGPQGKVEDYYGPDNIASTVPASGKYRRMLRSDI